MIAAIDVREVPLSLDEAYAAVAHASCGAVAIFTGVVRDSSGGRAVTRLEYSAYDRMAKDEMRRIAEEIANEIQGVRLYAVHRTGDLAVGDIAIVCAAASPHRAEAFRAARALIDRIKERVPVWKREHGPDGAAWAGWVDARCAPEGEHGHGHGHGHGH